MAFSDAAVARGHLEAYRADRRLDRHDLPLQALAIDLVVPQPDRRRLAEDDVGIAARRAGGATTVSSVPGRFFFICTGM